MRKAFLVASCLALLLVAVLVAGTGLGLAEGPMPVENARPTPTPDGLGPEASSSSVDIPALPDLIVTSIEVLPAVPMIDQLALIRITIMNQGLADVPLYPVANNFLSDLYVDPAVTPIQLGQDGAVEFPCQAWWVQSGDSWVLETPFVFRDVKSFALYAQVDTDGHVAEANENNNVFGPVNVEVQAPQKLVHETHQDFQMGLASGLDTSHPDGVLRAGIFWEPFTEPEIYKPDVMINDISGTVDGVTGDMIPTTVYQVRPALTGNGNGKLFAVWEDGRNGYWNRDIMFSRSDDGGATWGTDIDITAGVSGTQVGPAIAYDALRNRLYAVWQDSRNGSDDDDIYFAFSNDLGNTWSSPHQKLNDDIGTAQQVNPSIVVADPSLGAPVYVIWQDRRAGNDDIYLTRSDDGGLTWTDNYAVTDDPGVSQQNRMAPSIDVDGLGQVYAAWEDWRFPEHPEIYVSWSLDKGETFGVDIPVDIVGKGTSYRIEPALVVSTTREVVERFDEVSQMTYTEVCDIAAIHVAWQEGQGTDADVYYNYATFDYCEPDACEGFPYDFCFSPPHEAQKLNGFVIDSDYTMPPDPAPSWNREPSWQGHVSLARASSLDWTYCHASSVVTYSKGVFASWIDAGTHDDWRLEIQTRRAASKEGDPKAFELCEDQATGVLNDNAKLYAYRDDLDLYNTYRPAATGQARPSIYSQAPTAPEFSPKMYVAWDDDRWDAPMEPGTVRNRDVFFARRGAAAEAIYISPVIDGRSAPTWYALAWTGATQSFGDLLLQTRLGTDPYPPWDDVQTPTWTRWSGNPSTPSYGCPAGEGCYYDIPGRHIVGPDGTEWPNTYRYIQYKVIIRGDDRITALSRVVIHYEGTYVHYLPIIVRKH